MPTWTCLAGTFFTGGVLSTVLTLRSPAVCRCLQSVKNTWGGLCERGDPGRAVLDRWTSCILMFSRSWRRSTFRPDLPARDTGLQHEGFHQEPSDCNPSIINTPCVNSASPSAGASWPKLPRMRKTLNLNVILQGPQRIHCVGIQKDIPGCERASFLFSARWPPPSLSAAACLSLTTAACCLWRPGVSSAAPDICRPELWAS